MLKVICLKSCSIYDEFFDDYKIEIQEDCIYISYAHGCARICRDLLTDSFLLPLIN